ncbi:MAG: Urea transporter permease, partial [Nitrospira sp.]|nr:Urea transporter permease [Nitrospira sp.]
MLKRVGLPILLAVGLSMAALEAPGAVPPPAASPLEQALSQITSSDEAVRDAALRIVIELGDSTLIPRLDDIRANADRPVRLAIKPVMDLLRNRDKLSSPEPDHRRSAATDLGTSGKTVAIPWLEQAAATESNK